MDSGNGALPRHHAGKQADAERDRRYRLSPGA
jgi:hypothetical protein